MNDWALLGVPIYTLADYKGMGESPAALRGQGLAKAVPVQEDLGDVKIPILKKDRMEGRTKNLSHFIDATAMIFKATQPMDVERVLVVGGECSETLGAMAGLTHAFGGKAGMLWMDSHGDFNTPATSPSGYVGGMALAMACKGRQELVLDLGVGAPPLGEERLVHIGSRALDQSEISAFNSSPARLYTTQQVRKTGAAEVAEEAARHLENRSDWIACHLDVDVVDPELIPAVNYPEPGGLTVDEVALVIRKLAATQKLRAIELTAYNAAKDRRHNSAKTVIEMIRRGLTV